MNHCEVIRRYSNRKINSRTNTIEWYGGNVYCRDDVIYSYGRHFPMAVYVGGDLCKYVINSDKYSTSTSRHQNLVRRFCYGPALPRNALGNVGISFLELTAKNILFWRNGFSKFVFRNKENNTLHEIPKGQILEPNVFGKFKPYRSRSSSVEVEEGYETGWFIVDQVVVLSWKRKYFLVVKDEISQLTKKPDNISHAFELAADKKANSMFSKLGSKALAALS